MFTYKTRAGKKIKKTALIIAAILILVTACLVYKDSVMNFISGDTDGAAGSQLSEIPIKVITQPVSVTPDNKIFEAVGTGRARQSVGIYPSVAEEVTDVYFEAQEKVEKGQVLVQLDDREEKLAVRLAEVKLADAKSLLNRYEQAVKEGAVPQSEVDSARADVDSARVELEQAKLALEHRKVRAPFTGIVGISRIDPGDRIDTSTFITGLDDREVLFVDFEVPESLAGAIKTGQSITATTPAYPGETFRGDITALESRVDPEKRTVMVRASIENRSDLLRPGMSFKTRWEKTGSAYPTVPEIALQWGKDGSFVWIVRNNRAEKINTRVIARNAGRVLLDGNISEGDLVIVEGLERVSQGRKVIILNNSSNPETEKQVHIQ